MPPILAATERSGRWQATISLLDGCGNLLPKFEELGHRARVAANTGDAAARVLSYIDLNPLRAGMVKDPKD
jgi:hypothetical protein